MKNNNLYSRKLKDTLGFNHTIIDLSSKNLQGSFGHDKIDELKVPGHYKLPFKCYNSENDTIKNIVVNVVAIFSVNNLEQCITVFDGEFFWSFYYNGGEQCFKPNWENASIDEIYKWMDEELAN